MDMFNQGVIDTIIILIGVSTLITLAEYLGILPRPLQRFFRQNQLGSTLDVLRQLGLDVEKVRKRNIAGQINAGSMGEDPKSDTRSLLSQAGIKKRVQVGSVNPKSVDRFYDVMGLTTCPPNAKRAAQILSAYWRDRISNTSLVTSIDPDIIITPKTGSPLLGYEFAQIVDKPFTLFSETPKYQDNRNEASRIFDKAISWNNVSSALIVDDSVTGARKALSLAKELRSLGISVNDCLVLFEVTAKNGRSVLQHENVTLHAVLAIPNDM